MKWQQLDDEERYEILYSNKNNWYKFGDRYFKK
jgi:hypothetical protein